MTDQTFTNHNDSMQQINSMLDALEIFIKCEDGSGEVYNRKTGERFKLLDAGIQAKTNNIGGLNEIKNTQLKEQLIVKV